MDSGVEDLKSVFLMFVSSTLMLPRTLRYLWRGLAFLEEQLSAMRQHTRFQPERQGLEFQDLHFLLAEQTSFSSSHRVEGD